MAWRLLVSSFIKLNTDASVLQGRGYGGGLLRDHEGCVLFAYHKEFVEADVLLAKSLLLLHGLHIFIHRMVGTSLVYVDPDILVGLI